MIDSKKYPKTRKTVQYTGHENLDKYDPKKSKTLQFDHKKPNNAKDLTYSPDPYYNSTINVILTTDRTNYRLKSTINKMFVLLDNMEDHVSSPLKEEVIRNSSSKKHYYQSRNLDHPLITEFEKQIYKDLDNTPETKIFKTSPQSKVDSKNLTVNNKMTKNGQTMDRGSPIKRFHKHVRSAALVKETHKLLKQWL